MADDSDTDQRAHRHRHRKERVLHTRISENLAEDIRNIADDLRVPASNLVRNVLEEVFDVVESVSDDVGGLLGEVLDEADAARERMARSRKHSGRRGRRRERERAARRAVDEELVAAERDSGRPPPPPIAWHIVRDGRARGPLSRVELAEEARAGRFAHDSLVWCPGMPDWKPASEVPGVAELIGPPPVPEAEPPSPEPSA